MSTTFTLTQEQYEALIALARAGALTTGDAQNLEAFLRQIETASGVTRYSLWVQWQEMDQPLPPNTNFPAVWPPQLRSFMERLDRPIAKAEVIALVNSKAKRPTNLMCTRDPSALLGWTKITDFFQQ